MNSFPIGRPKYKFASWTWNFKAKLIIWCDCLWHLAKETWLSTDAFLPRCLTGPWASTLSAGIGSANLIVRPSFSLLRICLILSLDMLLPSKPAFDGVRTIYFKDNFMPDQVWRLESRRKKSRILRNNSKVLWSFFQWIQSMWPASPAWGIIKITNLFTIKINPSILHRTNLKVSQTATSGNLSL